MSLQLVYQQLIGGRLWRPPDDRVNCRFSSKEENHALLAVSRGVRERPNQLLATSNEDTSNGDLRDLRHEGDDTQVSTGFYIGVQPGSNNFLPAW